MSWKYSFQLSDVSNGPRTAASKITKAPGMTRNTTNSKNGEKVVNFQALL